jgi:pimeloyl-ACP methyl ester carboxylesterase
VLCATASDHRRTVAVDMARHFRFGGDGTCVPGPAGDRGTGAHRAASSRIRRTSPCSPTPSRRPARAAGNTAPRASSTTARPAPPLRELPHLDQHRQDGDLRRLGPGLEILRSFEPADLVGRWDAPAYFVHGSGDPIVPANVSRECAERFGGQYVQVPSQAHLVVIDQKEAVYKIVEDVVEAGA